MDRYTHVSLINVYSHLPDPAQFLRGLHRIMESNAYLLLVTGNGGDVPRSEFPGSLYLPDHLSFAGEENIRSVLDARPVRDPHDSHVMWRPHHLDNLPLTSSRISRAG